MEATEILVKMRERLETMGWVQRRLFNGSYQEACLNGTYLMCTMGEEITTAHDNPVLELLAHSIGELYPDRVGRIQPTIFLRPWDVVIFFNDHEDTTKEDVILVVKHAEKSAEENSLVGGL